MVNTPKSDKKSNRSDLTTHHKTAAEPSQPLSHEQSKLMMEMMQRAMEAATKSMLKEMSHFLAPKPEESSTEEEDRASTSPPLVNGQLVKRKPSSTAAAKKKVPVIIVLDNKTLCPSNESIEENMHPLSLAEKNLYVDVTGLNLEKDQTMLLRHFQDLCRHEFPENVSLLETLTSSTLRDRCLANVGYLHLYGMKEYPLDIARFKDVVQRALDGQKQRPKDDEQECMIYCRHSIYHPYMQVDYKEGCVCNKHQISHDNTNVQNAITTLIGSIYKKSSETFDLSSVDAQTIKQNALCYLLESVIANKINAHFATTLPEDLKKEIEVKKSLIVRNLYSAFSTEHKAPEDWLESPESTYLSALLATYAVHSQTHSIQINVDMEVKPSKKERQAGEVDCTTDGLYNRMYAKDTSAFGDLVDGAMTPVTTYVPAGTLFPITLTPGGMSHYVRIHTTGASVGLGNGEQAGELVFERDARDRKVPIKPGMRIWYVVAPSHTGAFLEYLMTDKYSAKNIGFNMFEHHPDALYSQSLFFVPSAKEMEQFKIARFLQSPGEAVLIAPGALHFGMAVCGNIITSHVNGVFLQKNESVRKVPCAENAWVRDTFLAYHANMVFASVMVKDSEVELTSTARRLGLSRLAGDSFGGVSMCPFCHPKELGLAVDKKIPDSIVAFPGLQDSANKWCIHGYSHTKDSCTCCAERPLPMERYQKRKLVDSTLTKYLYAPSMFLHHSYYNTDTRCVTLFNVHAKKKIKESALSIESTDAPAAGKPKRAYTKRSTSKKADAGSSEDESDTHKKKDRKSKKTKKYSKGSSEDESEDSTASAKRKEKSRKTKKSSKSASEDEASEGSSESEKESSKEIPKEHKERSKKRSKESSDEGEKPLPSKRAKVSDKAMEEDCATKSATVGTIEEKTEENADSSEEEIREVVMTQENATIAVQQKTIVLEDSLALPGPNALSVPSSPNLVPISSQRSSVNTPQLGPFPAVLSTNEAAFFDL
jgi:hypothetical protein